MSQLTTWLTPSMWRPREATSVATRIGQLPVLEVVQDLEPLLLVHVAGERARLPAVAAEPVLEPPRLLAGVGEDQDAAAALAAQQAEQEVELLLAADVVEHLLGLLHRLLLRGDA